MAIDAGTLVVNVVPNTAGFNTKLTALMKGVGAKLNTPGAALGAGLAIAGAAAIKAATDFEAAFTRIDAISNASSANIEQWKGQVLSLAGETAQSPQELADALYFLASAGLETSQVMEVLEQSAKGSAIGLGTTTDIAKISAQALNAYAQSGLTATEVTDTLVAAVREGTAEPEEFAVALGRVLPIASRAGVGFDEVTASLASLSNIGLNVNEGTTALRGLLQALVAPSGQAAEALGEIGISAQEMRDTISEGGLLKALQLLEDRTGGNIDQLRKIIPNIRALTGELGLTGENAKKVQEVFDTVLASQGDAAEAFAITAKGPMFEFNQVLAEGQVLLIQFGEILLPIAQTIAGVLGPALGAVGGFLSENADLVRNLIIAYLGFKAITFVPVLLSAIATALEGMAAAGLANIASGLIGISKGLAAVGATQTAAGLEKLAALLPGLAVGAGPVVLGITALGLAAFQTKKYIDSLDDSSTRLVEQFGISQQLADAAHDAATGLGARDLLSEIADPNIFGGDTERADEFATTMANLSAEGQKMGLTFAETDQILLQHKDILNKNRASQDEYGAAVERSFGEQLRANTEETLRGILDFGEGITRVGLAGKYTTSLYDQFGATLLDNTKLTLGQKASVAGQVEQLYELGGSLDYANAKWLQSAIASGNFEEITDRLGGKIAKLSGDLGKNVPSALKKATEGVTNFATALGSDFGSVSQEAFAAVVKDGKTLGETFDGVVSDMEDKWLDLQSTFAEGLGGFGTAALDELLSKTSFTTQGVIDSFEKAKKATQDFGRDLLTIAKSGGQAGEELATTLATAGPDAANFADFIASASKKGRDAMIQAFGAQGDAASRLATKLTTTIAGALTDIRRLLEALVNDHFDLNVDLHDNATPKIHAVANAMRLLDGTTATVVIDTRGVAHGGANTGQADRFSEFGSYIPGAARGGFVTVPQAIHVAERHKAEMILPLTNSAGEKALAKAMGNAARRLDGGMVRGGDGGTAKLVISGPVKLQVGKTSMDAYISGVARGEDDNQKRYDERIGRMRRD